MDFLNETLNWAVHGDSYEKIGFIKAFLNCLGLEELNHIKKICHREKSKAVVKARSWIGPRIEDIQRIRANAASRRKAATAALPLPAEAVITPGPAVITPAEAVSADEKPVFKRSTWWRKDSHGNPRPREAFVSFDVEGIQDAETKGFDGEKAGEVGLVDHKGDKVYYALVKREPYSYLTDTIGAKIAGMTDPFKLQNGEDEDIVKCKMETLLKPKVAIMCGAAKDFRLVGLKPNNFEVFDLQEFYCRPSPFAFNCQKMSLRDMYFYHFEEDCQPPGRPHCALDDARATMRVFMEGYTKTENFLNKRGEFEPDFSNVPNLKKMSKLGLKYCKFQKQFVANCHCALCGF